LPQKLHGEDSVAKTPCPTITRPYLPTTPNNNKTASHCHLASPIGAGPLSGGAVLARGEAMTNTYTQRYIPIVLVVLNQKNAPIKNSAFK